MQTISHSRPRQFVIVTFTCLLILMAIATSLMMNPLTSFARSNQLTRSQKANSNDVVVKRIKKTVAGTTRNILGTLGDLALYRFTGEQANKPDCTGACAKDWPPLLFTGSGTPQSQDNIGSHKLAVINNTNGKQVTYDGHLLYTYSDDAADSQHTVHGQGEKLPNHSGKWEVISE